MTEYSEPNNDFPCGECKWMRVSKTYKKVVVVVRLRCLHEPPPSGLGESREVKFVGHCNYWEMIDG